MKVSADCLRRDALPPIDFNDGVPIRLMGADTLSARWTTFVASLKPTYSFCTRAENGGGRCSKHHRPLGDRPLNRGGECPGSSASVAHAKMYTWALLPRA